MLDLDLVDLLEGDSRSFIQYSRAEMHRAAVKVQRSPLINSKLGESVSGNSISTTYTDTQKA